MRTKQHDGDKTVEHILIVRIHFFLIKLKYPFVISAAGK